MSEEHKCTEECIGQLEDIVAQLQAEHQQDLGRIAQLEEENAQLLRDGINGFLNSGFGSDLDEALDRLLRKSEKRVAQLEEALRFYAEIENYWSYYDGGLNDSDVARDSGEKARAALSPSEASQKEQCQCQSGSSALGQCKLEVGHTEDCAFEFAEAPEKEEE